MSETTIGLSKRTRDMLKELKTVPEEYYDSVIFRLVDFYKKHGGNEK